MTILIGKIQKTAISNNGRSKKICNLCSSITTGLTKILSLNTLQIEEDFFEETRLIAIRAALEGYKLCWYLNNYLKLDFKRYPEMDIGMEISSSRGKKAGSLFENILPEKTEVYFPVYHYVFPFSEANIFLYTNNVGGNILLPDVKQADYLLLMQYSEYMNQSEKYLNCISAIPNVSMAIDRDVSTLKWKRNLVV